jgi:hypothetical protein
VDADTRRAATKIDALPPRDQIPVLVAVVAWASRATGAPELARAEAVLGNPDLWPEGKDLFLQTRKHLLRSAPHSSTRESILLLVENVAKAAANASGVARYDSDVASAAVAIAMDMSERLGSDTATELAAIVETNLPRVTLSDAD